MGTTTVAVRTTPDAGLGERALPRALTDLLWTTPFLVLYWVQLAHHQLWRDELNAFGIAASAGTFRHLIFLVHYEGHPWLWYALLWLVGKATLQPVGMKLLQAAIGTAIYLLIGLASPFSRLEKLALFLCYFVCFEYTVPSRMYGLMLLFALLYVRRRALKPAAAGGNAVLLGVLANTDMTGLVLSGALLLEFAFSVWKARRGTQEAALKDGGPKRLAGAMAIYCALAFLSIFTLWPTKDISSRTTGKPFQLASLENTAGAAMNYVEIPYFATMTGIPGEFWNTYSFRHRIFFKLGLPVILLLYWLCLRRHGNLLVLLGAACVCMVLVGDLLYMGNMRNFGTTFVAFLACLWLMRAAGERIPWAGMVLLGLTVLAGVDAEAEQWMRPFSNARNTAMWLEQQGLGGLPWVGSKDTSTIGVAEQARHPLYMLECNCTDTFLLFGKRRDQFDRTEIATRLALARTNLRAPRMVYIGTLPLSDGEATVLRAEGFSIEPLRNFEGAEVPEEDFYTYELDSGGGS